MGRREKKRRRERKERRRKEERKRNDEQGFKKEFESGKLLLAITEA
jgi:hypothetical protein